MILRTLQRRCREVPGPPPHPWLLTAHGGRGRRQTLIPERDVCSSVTPVTRVSPCNRHRNRVTSDLSPRRPWGTPHAPTVSPTTRPALTRFPSPRLGHFERCGSLGHRGQAELCLAQTFTKPLPPLQVTESPVASEQRHPLRALRGAFPRNVTPTGSQGPDPPSGAAQRVSMSSTSPRSR